MTPENLAQACSKVMHSKDYAAQALAIEIIESRPGYALAQMQVRRDMVNGPCYLSWWACFSLCAIPLLPMLVTTPTK